MSSVIIYDLRSSDEKLREWGEMREMRETRETMEK